MKKIFTTMLALATVTAIQAASISLAVKDTRKQTITGFGAASCDGAMKPFGTDTQPARLLYGDESKIGLNIMRMEISPSFTGDNWGDYDWNGSLPSARIVKQRGGIVFGTPWSPPGEYKTNGTAQGGNSDSQGKKRGKLREDCYDKFFPWLNTFLKWMKSKGVTVDAVSIQNEPDWWVDYSGCLYDPADLVKLVKNYAYMLDRETYSGVKLISGESLGFTQNYTDPLMNDPTCREQIDIVAGHLYGHAPLTYMKQSAVLAAKYGKEVWMTEHSVTDNIDHLPNWHEQLIFAEELNECMLAGCTGYIYWYMRAHWAFVGTGETKYNVGDMKNTKNKLLPRAYVMSHFSKHVTGSTRLVTSRDKTSGEGATHEYSAYIKGDSLIVMAIDTTKNGVDLKILLPYQVKSGTHILSTGNEPENLCQESPIAIDEPTKEVIVPMPARSLNTYIFMIDKGSTAIEERAVDTDDTKVYYDIHGRRLDTPKGLCIEKLADGSSRKVYLGR
ncbi:MAG: endo-1,4-beta-xylanase xyn5A [Prevotella sp.]|nr:endo-1,4-beta-xylanase xyn5A [Prevotella sp.]MBR6828531.1 endo-1,4-beta-xylanase xyn5A [Prevotella sp.]